MPSSIASMRSRRSLSLVTAGRGGYHAARAIAAAAIALAGLAWAGPCRAHATDLSRSELVWQGDGAVRARIVLAAADVARVTRGDVAVELPALVRRSYAVSADGAPCEAGALTLARDEDDGLAVSGAYACAADARELAVVVTLPDELGSGHRHLATLQEGDRASSRLLGAASRRASLALAPRGAAVESVARGPKAWPAAWALGAAMLAALLIVTWCGRIPRRPWT